MTADFYEAIIWLHEQISFGERIIAAKDETYLLTKYIQNEEIM